MPQYAHGDPHMHTGIGRVSVDARIMGWLCIGDATINFMHQKMCKSEAWQLCDACLFLAMMAGQKKLLERFWKQMLLLVLAPSVE